MSRTLIIIEEERTKHALELLKVASQIHDDHCETYALVINGDTKPLLGGFDVLVNVQDETLKWYDPVAVGDVVAGLQQTYDFDSIVAIEGQWSKRLLPRVAAMLKVGLVTDVRGINKQDQQLQFLRPAHGRGMMALVELMTDGPVMVTVRPKIFHQHDTGVRQSRIIEPKGLRFRTGGIRQIGKQTKIEHDICDSAVLISGGGGVARDFAALTPLAQALGGQVSASRSLVDRDLAPKKKQVGQSGKTVSPRLYMALGIHGAIQHVMALENVDTIISVNTNANAPICSLSDLVVKGDAIAFVGKLLKKIKEEQSNGTH